MAFAISVIGTFLPVNGGNSTIYTYDVGKKNTTEGSSVTVNANVYSNYVFYAQAEENIINNKKNGSNGTYYAYSDQKTVITEHSNQKYSTNSVLNIMNTDDISDQDGAHNDLSIIFNVKKNQKKLWLSQHMRNLFKRS